MAATTPTPGAGAIAPTTTTSSSSERAKTTPDALSAALRDRIPKLQPRRRPAPPTNPTPVPETPPLPPPLVATTITTTTGSSGQQHVFSVPCRRILSADDHALFLQSPTCGLLQAWVFGLADAVEDTPAGVFAEALEQAGRPGLKRGTKTTAQRALSPVILALLALLDEAEALVYAHPPDEAGGSRFGNKRFRDFVDAVRQRAPEWQRRLLGLDKKEEAVREASAYLAQAFGNRARIDYGSGHELHFVVWLLCLYQLGVVAAADRAALVLVVFGRYLTVMRLVQTTYYLEPAGSHGVWGLDDYQFLPFLFGAAQLLHHPYITPRAVHQPLTLEQFGDDYLYLGQVRFVNSIKVASAAGAGQDEGFPSQSQSKGQDDAVAAARRRDNSLRWHSPMLDDISAAKSWAKIEGGMRRMFLAEVLRKLPVMQHFLFGSLVPAADGMTLPPPAQVPHNENAENESAESDPNYYYNDDEEEDAVVDGNDTVDVFERNGVRHIHNPSGWGDCCGIRVPSSLGAAGEIRKHGGGALRRIPFD